MLVLDIEDSKQLRHLLWFLLHAWGRATNGDGEEANRQYHSEDFVQEHGPLVWRGERPSVSRVRTCHNNKGLNFCLAPSVQAAQLFIHIGFACTRQLNNTAGQEDYSSKLPTLSFSLSLSTTLFTLGEKTTWYNKAELKFIKFKFCNSPPNYSLKPPSPIQQNN